MGDNTPGQLTTETQTLTAPNIRRVDLIPSTGIADGDYVAYDLTFVRAPCPPTGDPVMDDPGFSDRVADLLQDASRSTPLVNRQERADYVIKDNSTESIRYERSPIQGSCGGIPLNDVPGIVSSLQLGANEQLIGIVHSHVIFAGEDVTSCTSGLPPYDPDALGGGSDLDWNYVNNPVNAGVRVYAVSPERIHFLPPGLTNEEAQKANPNGYDNSGGCATR